jgi:hypothetical protein
MPVPAGSLALGLSLAITGAFQALISPRKIFATVGPSSTVAAERCGRDYRDLTLAIAASWLSLARHQESVDELLVIWSEARHVPSTASAVTFPISSQFVPAGAPRAGLLGMRRVSTP